ncbi:MAG: NAD(+) diphosphatase [Gammaproteobacteria bacterium]|nr:NAD(+) diphosphatase [Gammaproteobacteria bacterium]
MKNQPIQSNQSALSYTGMPLERNPVLRDNVEWIAQQYQSPNAQFLALNNQANLVNWQIPSNSPTPVRLTHSQIPDSFHRVCQSIYLGQTQTDSGDAPVFAVDFTKLKQEYISEWLKEINPICEFIDLRSVSSLLPGDEASILGYARGLSFWHQNHLFCGRCGSSTSSKKGGHVRKCDSEGCAKEAYPRIDPAVIMLVELVNPTDGVAKCLLGRHKSLPGGIYSTLAGYVDHGESMDEAVAREVMEEAGLLVHHTEYIASQPWPFPSSLMIGFRAQTREENIIIAPDELEDAQWFTAEQIRGFGEYANPDAEKALPRKDSIARNLIELWLQDKA